MARRVTSKDKWKNKIWYELIAPPMFGEKPIGETPASDPNQVMGRTVEVIASNLTGIGKQNYVKLLFEVNQVSGKKAKTRLTGFEVMGGYLRSVVQRRRTKIDGVFEFKTKDDIKIRVKCVAITFRVCHTEQAKAIRNKIQEILNHKFEQTEFRDLLNDLLNRQIQNNIKDEVRKIMPLSNMEIGKLEIL
ncbi:MAG: 30S ribosomal protein S3ae [Candidatus Altiarchaeota archaeon]|nr:30S ribosomal protein S3ae [Candidatus Altiarchaeota archaeon]